MYRELLDDRIGEQFGCQFRDPLLGGRLAQFDLKPLALPNCNDLAEAETAARTGNGIALGVVDLGLEHHLDDESAHTRTVREPIADLANREAELANREAELANREGRRRAVALS
jgi:hypothetical protein